MRTAPGPALQLARRRLGEDGTGELVGGVDVATTPRIARQLGDDRAAASVAGGDRRGVGPGEQRAAQGRVVGLDGAGEGDQRIDHRRGSPVAEHARDDAGERHPGRFELAPRAGGDEVGEPVDVVVGVEQLHRRVQLPRPPVLGGNGAAHLDGQHRHGERVAHRIGQRQPSVGAAHQRQADRVGHLQRPFVTERAGDRPREQRHGAEAGDRRPFVGVEGGEQPIDQRRHHPVERRWTVDRVDEMRRALGEGKLHGDRPTVGEPQQFGRQALTVARRQRCRLEQASDLDLVEGQVAQPDSHPIERWPTAGHVEPTTRHDGSAPGGERADQSEQEADGLGIETLHVVDQEAHRLGTALQRVVQRLGRPLGAGRCQGIGGVGHPRPAHGLDDQAEQRVGARRERRRRRPPSPPRTTRRAGGRTSTCRTRREPRPGRADARPPARRVRSATPRRPRAWSPPDPPSVQSTGRRPQRRPGDRRSDARRTPYPYVPTIRRAGLAGPTTSRRRNNAWTHRRTRNGRAAARGG